MGRDLCESWDFHFSSDARVICSTKSDIFLPTTILHPTHSQSFMTLVIMPPFNRRAQSWKLIVSKKKVTHQIVDGLGSEGVAKYPIGPVPQRVHRCI